MPIYLKSLLPVAGLTVFLLVAHPPGVAAAPAAADTSRALALQPQHEPIGWTPGPTGQKPTRISLARAALILSLGGLAAVWAHAEDDLVDMQRVLDQPMWDAPSDLGNLYGDGWVIGGASLAVFSVGKFGGDPATAALGGDMCESFLLTSAVTTAVKYAVNRRRPSGGGHSFPSGQTAVAFCMVPVLGYHLGWKVAVPAAIIAGTTATGRVEDGYHFLSDVWFSGPF